MRAFLAACILATGAVAQECVNKAVVEPDYTAVLALENSGSTKAQLGLPGATRSVHTHNYAVVAPESRVWARNEAWPGCKTAHIASNSTSKFSMYFVQMQGGDSGGYPGSGKPEPDDTTGVQRFALVLQGTVQLYEDYEVKGVEGFIEGMAKPTNHTAGDWMWCPGTGRCNMQDVSGDAAMLVVERQPEQGYKAPKKVKYGSVQDSPLLDTAPEMFALRKLLPDTKEYVFNMHVMDFAPGEHLVTHEVHYNTHGLVMLQGQGIYRLNEDWHPVKAGDAIWMAPYVPQWYAALGQQPTRYIIYKDTTLDPTESK